MRMEREVNPLLWLRDAARQDRIAHFFLFHGGGRKERLRQALQWAALLNCQAEIETRPCGVCLPCWKIGNGTHPDVELIQPIKTSIGIDQVLSLHRKAARKPYEGMYKAYIIEEADKLTLPAANALLKLAEEPPPRTIIVLSATSDAAVLPTLRSRAQVLYFPPDTEAKQEESILCEAWKLSGQDADLAEELERAGVDQVRAWLAAYRQAVAHRDFLQLFALFPLEKERGRLLLQALLAETMERLKSSGEPDAGPRETTGGTMEPALDAGSLSFMREALNAVQRQADVRLAIEVMALKHMALEGS